MDQIFDRLGNLLRSAFQDGDDQTSSRDPFSQPGFDDPDLKEAWNELNDFMNSDTGSSHTGSTAYSRPDQNTSLPTEVRNAYQTLGVPATATNEEVGKAYKSLLLRHHPDRFATDPKKLADATERTKQINHAFQEIKSFRASHAS